MTSLREWLVSKAYPDGRNLAARRSIYVYRTPQCDLPARWRTASGWREGTFKRVRRLDFTGWVTLTEPERLVRFIGSTMPYFRGVPAGPVLGRVRARTAAAIEAAGAFRFRSHTGLLVGS